MKGKKPLIALVALLFVGVVGVTFAYFTETETFQNIFKITDGGYGTDIYEEFESPTDWLPGQEISKKVYVNNTGDIPVVVRVSYDEAWDPTTLTGKMADGSSVAIIKFANSSDWTKNGNYYYYNKVLAKGAKTSTFIESVTLNPELDLASDYIGASYKLNIHVETIQADGATDEWGVTSDTVSGL